MGLKKDNVLGLEKNGQWIGFEKDNVLALKKDNVLALKKDNVLGPGSSTRVPGRYKGPGYQGTRVGNSQQITIY